MAEIEVAGAWARPTVGPSRVSAAYMTIANKGAAADRLKSAHTPKAKSVELHQTTMTADGVMQMRQLEDGLPVAAGSSLALRPGGTHFMLLGLEDALEAGQDLILTLEFAKAGMVEVVVPVSATAPQTEGASP
jgi:copper(I)-binding protein